MRAKERVVVDTNALVSRLLIPGSIPGQAVRKAVAEAQPLASDDTLMELADVLARPKFDPYVTVEERREFLRLFNRIAEKSRSPMSCAPAATRRTTSFSSWPSMAPRN